MTIILVYSGAIEIWLLIYKFIIVIACLEVS